MFMVVLHKDNFYDFFCVNFRNFYCGERQFRVQVLFPVIKIAQIKNLALCIRENNSVKTGNILKERQVFVDLKQQAFFDLP